jgi:hypothetical protein
MYREKEWPGKLKWRKSLRSLTNGECVEVARAMGWVAVRDSQAPEGAMLNYSTQSWRTFVKKTKDANKVQ